MWRPRCRCLWVKRCFAHNRTLQAPLSNYVKPGSSLFLGIWRTFVAPRALSRRWVLIHPGTQHSVQNVGRAQVNICRSVSTVSGQYVIARPRPSCHTAPGSTLRGYPSNCGPFRVDRSETTVAENRVHPGGKSARKGGVTSAPIRRATHSARRHGEPLRRIGGAGWLQEHRRRRFTVACRFVRSPIGTSLHPASARTIDSGGYCLSYTCTLLVG